MDFGVNHPVGKIAYRCSFHLFHGQTFICNKYVFECILMSFYGMFNSLFGVSIFYMYVMYVCVST